MLFHQSKMEMNHVYIAPTCGWMHRKCTRTAVNVPFYIDTGDYTFVFRGMRTKLRCHMKLSVADIIYCCKFNTLPSINETLFETVVIAWQIEDVYKSRGVFLSHGDASLYFPSTELTDEGNYFCYTNYLTNNCSAAYSSTKSVQVKVYGM